MAEIQDNEELGEMEAVDEDQKASETVEQAAPELPERYRGKAIDDVIKMHQEAEKLIARQAQEVGETRRLADELIKSQLHPTVKEEKQEVDFFENPNEAIRRAVESNPKVMQAEQYAVQARQEMARQELLKRHPDALQLIQDQDFVSWVNATKTRQRLAREADQGYDVDAADELYSTYKAIKKPVQTPTKPVSAEEKTAREKTLKSVATETGGSGESSRKIYRRADLIQLKLRDPQAFAARQDEIDLAYQEGRVR